MKRIMLMAFLAGPLWLVAGCGEGPEPDTSQDKNVVVVIETSKGTIKAELFAEKAPITVENFLKYVDDKFYDNTTFHRVIADFMIQGGGWELELEGKGLREKHGLRSPIKNESSNRLKNKRGTLAMARTDVPNSAASEFFINVKDNDFLDRAKAKDGVGYAVFGKVIDGMGVVESIENVSTSSGNRPVKDVIIKSIRRG
jgi:cyclophilin family peptidyl-prolyl cis-trans isomerase